MTQHMTGQRARGGWREEETRLLFDRVSLAEKEGIPLRAVFDDVGRELSRKPNSIRNFYYAKVHESPELTGERKPAFRVFTQDETRELIAAVLLARGRGASVRACVRELAQGDPKQMLRYQNKYRAVMKSRPELLSEIAQELSLQGVSVPEAVLERRPLGKLTALEQAVERYTQMVGDRAAHALIDAMLCLIERASTQDTGESAGAAAKSQVRM